MPEILFESSFWLAVLQIIAIDILLGGDNAVVIALACRKLPEEQRRRGIFWGVAGAIGLRVVLIFLRTATAGAAIFESSRCAAAAVDRHQAAATGR
jgi:predicted tellurium resistance membrane protein TerC